MNFIIEVVVTDRFYCIRCIHSFQQYIGGLVQDESNSIADPLQLV